MASAKIIRGKELLSAIDTAVAAAVKRRSIAAVPPRVFGPGPIMGLILRDVDTAQAFSLAEEVTASVNKVDGVEALPAMIRLPTGILMGFYDRSPNLHELGDG
jgi:hypothetical protein